MKVHCSDLCMHDKKYIPLNGTLLKKAIQGLSNKKLHNYMWGNPFLHEMVGWRSFVTETTSSSNLFTELVNVDEKCYSSGNFVFHRFSQDIQIVRVVTWMKLDCSSWPCTLQRLWRKHVKQMD